MAYGKKCDTCGEKYRHYHRPGDARPLPSVTEILGIIAKPALTGWAFKMARETALAATRAAYASTHPTGMCLALDESSFAAIIDKTAPRSQWQLPKTAADIGTLVHARIESEIRRELGQDVAEVPVPEFEVVDGKKVAHPAWNSMQAYYAWREAHEVKVISIEERVYSMELGFAGTADVICYIDDVLTLGDFKTSKAVYPEYRLQVAAYRTALVEMSQSMPLVFMGAKELQVKKPGGVILRFPKDAGDTFEAVDVPWADQKALMAGFNAALALWTWQQGAA